MNIEYATMNNRCGLLTTCLMTTHNAYDQLYDTEWVERRKLRATSSLYFRMPQ